MFESTPPIKPATEAEQDHRLMGLALALTLAAPALWVWFGAGKQWLWTLPMALACAVLAISAPQRLAPVNRIFHRITNAVHHALGQLALATIFFGLVTPMGLILRLFRGLSMPLHRDTAANSYWLRSNEEKPWKEYFLDQF